MGAVGKRGPLAGMDLEFVGDRLKKGFKRRDTFKGGFAMLSALAMATGVGQSKTAAEGLASLGLIPEDLPSKKYKAATSEIAAASTWVAHGMDTAKLFGDLLGVEVTSLEANFAVEQQLQDLQSIASQSFDFVAVHPASSTALTDAANQIIANGTPLIVMDTRIVQDPEEFANFGHLTFLEPDNIYMGSTVAKSSSRRWAAKGRSFTRRVFSRTPELRAERRDFARLWRTIRTSRSLTRPPATGSRIRWPRSGRTCCSASRTCTADSSTPTIWPSPPQRG